MHHYAEIAPDRCPNGHQLGPKRVLVGWEPGDPGARTHTCTTCRATVRTPADQIEHAWIEAPTTRQN